MPNDYAMYQGYNVEGAKEVNITSNQNVEYEMNGSPNMNLCGKVMPQVYEPMRERCIHRTICHEVPQE